MKPPPPLKPHQIAIAAAALVSLALWAIPPVHWVMLPMTYLNTHVHELCHALAALATGGQVERITVSADGSGLTWTAGGIRLIVSSAGYVGASIAGAAIMFCSRTEKAAKTTLMALAGVLALDTLIWVRGDAVGFTAGIFWIAALYAMARYFHGPKVLFAAQFVGLQQCLNAATSLYTLLQVSAFSEGTASDATNMQNSSGIPALFWALLWCGFSLLMVTLGLRRAWSESPERKTSHPNGLLR